MLKRFPWPARSDIDADHPWRRAYEIREAEERCNLIWEGCFCFEYLPVIKK